MFMQNDLIDYAGASRRTIRILWIDHETETAFIYELGRANGAPLSMSLRLLVEQLQSRQARLLLTDPYRAGPHPDPLERHRRLQQKAWHAVLTLHQHVPALYVQSARVRAIAAYAAQHGMSAASVMRYLRRYWERGQTPDALWPDYARSGAPGKMRPDRGAVKRGRPRKDAASGTNADSAMRVIFRAAAARYRDTHDLYSQRAAYRQMLADDFQDHEPGALPSYGQFVYWLARGDTD